MCGTCGTPLTGTRQTDKRKPDRPVVRIIYECSRGHDVPHPKRSVHENVIWPVVRKYVEHYLPIYQKAFAALGPDAITQLEDRRKRILDMYESGDITKAEKEARLRPTLAALAEVQAYDPKGAAVWDWDWSPEDINAALRKAILRIDLDPETLLPRPGGLVWRIPNVARSANRTEMRP
jgi:hypothetical protein